jgi:predicted MFS family arabinose efflux permease
MRVTEGSTFACSRCIRENTAGRANEVLARPNAGPRFGAFPRDQSTFPPALPRATALLALSGVIGEHFNLNGLMITMVLLNLLGLMTVRWVPTKMAAAVNRRPVERGEDHRTPRMSIVRLGATLLLLYSGHNALWSYQERMGLAIGLAPPVIGVVLASSVAGGILGSILATLTGVRKGSAAPELLSYAALIVAALLFASGRNAETYIAVAILIKAAWFFGLPYLQGALAQLDPSGRAVVICGALQTAGTALGTGAAAVIVPYGYKSVGILGAAVYLVCIPLSIGVLGALDRASAPKVVQSSSKEKA